MAHSLRKIRREEILRNPQATQFVAFVQERDSLGHIINPQQRDPILRKMVSLDASPKVFSAINHNIEKFFRLQTIWKEEKSRIKKKSIISQDPPIVTQRVESIEKIQEPKSCGDTLSQTKHKSMSLRACSLLKENPLTSIKNNPVRINVAKNYETAKSSQEIRLVCPEKWLNCAELSRYNQMKKLTSNICEDFQEGHSRFLTKIKESKMLALKLKQELDM